MDGYPTNGGMCVCVCVTLLRENLEGGGAVLAVALIHARRVLCE